MIRQLWLLGKFKFTLTEIEIDKYIGRGECIDTDTVIVRNWPT